MRSCQSCGRTLDREEWWASMGKWWKSDDLDDFLCDECRFYKDRSFRGAKERAEGRRKQAKRTRTARYGKTAGVMVVG